MYNQLQVREIFHLEFLKWFGRKVKSSSYALKGGTNLRFFFNSFRYSEDMDLDVRGVKKDTLLDIVKGILDSPHFTNTLKPFGIERIVPPNIARAKQTETTQRFKVHLITYAGEDLFTKIEFSRRGFKGKIVIESISDSILRIYKLPPLLTPHYDIYSMVKQKIETLGGRTIAQPRDIFDLYILSSQYTPTKNRDRHLFSSRKRGVCPCFSKAHERIFEISFEEFQSTVIFYLLPEDQKIYGTPDAWDEIKLKVANFLEGLRNEND